MVPQNTVWESFLATTFLRAISHVRIELKSNVSEAVSASIITAKKSVSLVTVLLSLESEYLQIPAGNLCVLSVAILIYLVRL
jgi:hypothetical protein